MPHNSVCVGTSFCSVLLCINPYLQFLLSTAALDASTSVLEIVCLTGSIFALDDRNLDQTVGQSIKIAEPLTQTDAEESLRWAVTPLR